MSVLIEPTESGVVFIVTCFFFFSNHQARQFFFFWRFIVVTGGFLRSTVECVYLRAKIHHLLLVCVSP